MNLILEDPKDIINYLTYADSKGTLEETISLAIQKLSVPENEIMSFMKYRQKELVTQDTKTSEPIAVVTKKDLNSNTVWSIADLKKLKICIDESTNIKVVAKMLNRSPKAIFNKALGHYKTTYSYKTNTWLPKSDKD